MISLRNIYENGGLVSGVNTTKRVTGLAICVSLLATCRLATASIIFTMPPEPINAGILPDEPPAAIDLDGDGVIDYIIPGSFSQINVYPQGFNQALSTDQFGTLYAANLSAGLLIGADPGEDQVWGAAPAPIMAACFNAGGLFCGGNFLGGIGYLGAEFDIAGDTHYGWLEISSLDGIPYIDVLSWAYESEPGVGILAGAIPEPSATAMLLAAGWLILRRRRQSHRE